MTVTDLIEVLSTMPGELTVMADDYENGRYSVTGAEVTDMYGVYPMHVVIK